MLARIFLWRIGTRRDPSAFCGDPSCQGTGQWSSHKTQRASTEVEAQIHEPLVPKDSLCVDTALPDGVRHAINGQHVRRDAIVDVVGLSVANHVVKRRLHDAFQLFVDD